MWYAGNEALLGEYGDKVMPREHEWDARWWSPIINAEHLAMRERAGIFDLSAFCVFDVVGPGAKDAVQGIVVAQADVAQHEIRFLRLRQRDARASGPRVDNIVAVVLQRCDEQHAHGDFVVDDEDFRHWVGGWLDRDSGLTANAFCTLRGDLGRPKQKTG